MVCVGATLALFISDAAVIEIGESLLIHERIFPFLCALERLLGSMVEVVGRRPLLTYSYKGRSVCEVDFLENAAGLAHHGRAGFACGPAFLKESLESCFSSHPYIHHVFGYESFRNHLFPEVFTPPFKYACLEGPECWGWLNQGLVNIVGCLLLQTEEPGGWGFSYYGKSAAAFRAGMEAHLLIYSLLRLSGKVEWGDAFLHERLPWAQDQSLDNLYSGMISMLYRDFGGVQFLKGFLSQAPGLLRERSPSTVHDFTAAAENFYLACSIAARSDLYLLFTGLGFPIQNAQCLVGALLEQ